MAELATGRWFDMRTRLSQRAYVRLVIRLNVVCIAILWAAIWIGAHGFRVTALALVAGIVAVCLAGLPLTVRRLHDRGRSGWWLGLTFVPWAASFPPIESVADRYPALVIGYVLVFLGATLWFLLETLGRRGTPGPNRYGPDPT